MRSMLTILAVTGNAVALVWLALILAENVSTFGTRVRAQGVDQSGSREPDAVTQAPFGWVNFGRR